MDAGRIIVSGMIMRQRARIENVGALSSSACRRTRIEENFRIVADQRFWKWRRQRQKRPVPGARGKPRIDAMPHVPSRDDVEHRKLRKAAGMIEREAVADASATIVTTIAFAMARLV